MKPVSLRQQELLVEFMARHRDLALGRVRSKEGRALSARLWTELASILNCEAVDPCAYRTAKDWNKFYNDYKCRIKNKVRRIAQSQRQTGGGPSDAPPLSELEERLCAIIGPDKFEPLPVRQESVLISLLDTEAGQDGFYPDNENFESMTQTQNVEELIAQEANIEIIQDKLITVDPLTNINKQIAQEANIEIIQDELATVDPLTTMYQRSRQKKTAKEPTETEVDKAKTVLADIERARIEVSRSQVQAQLARNTIEKSKVEALNNLAMAAWTLVDLFKPKESNKRKRARSPSSSDED